MNSSAGYPNIAIVSIDWLRHSYEVGKAAALGPYRVRPTAEQKERLLRESRERWKFIPSSQCFGMSLH